MKWYGKYGRKVSWKVKEIRKIWKENKLKSENTWEIEKKGKLNSEKDMENTEEK